MSGGNGLKLSQEGTTVGVLGGGAWGTALAFHCVRKGHNTMLWARETEVVEGINGPDHENTMFLKVSAWCWVLMMLRTLTLSRRWGFLCCLVASGNQTTFNGCQFVAQSH